MLIQQWHLFALQFIPDFDLLVKFFFELILLIFLFDLNIFNTLHALPFYSEHFIFVPADEIFNIDFFFLQFFGFNLQFLQIFFDIICLLCFLFDNFIAAGNSGSKIIDIAFIHFAFSEVIVLGIDMLIEVLEQHLDYETCTVILLLSGSS